MNDPIPSTAPTLGLLPSKTKAALLHLLISGAVVGAFIVFALLVWYPSPLLETSGLLTIVLILVSVDLILGPALTFILYRPNKKGLKLDLSLVAAVQLVALAYGMHTIYSAHPVYIVYNVDRFTLMTPNDVDPNRAQYAALKVSGWWKPVLVYAEPPQDPRLAQQITFDALAGKGDIDTHPELYKPLHDSTPNVLGNGIQPEQFNNKPSDKQALTDFLQQHGKTTADYRFLPLVNKARDVVWVWERASNTPVGILDIDPWQGKTTLSANP